MGTALGKLQYITDENGQKTAVILSLEAYYDLLEDLSDLAAVAERRDEPTIPLSVLVDSLKADGLLLYRVEDLGGCRPLARLLDSSARFSILYSKEGAMQSTYRVRADELTEDFVQALKVAYKDKEIEIVVSDVVDDTDYLLSTEANRERLLRAIKDIEAGENLASFSLDNLLRA